MIVINPRRVSVTKFENVRDLRNHLTAMDFNERKYCLIRLGLGTKVMGYERFILEDAKRMLEEGKVLQDKINSLIFGGSK